MSQTLPPPLSDPFAPGFTGDPRLEASIALARLTARFPGVAPACPAEFCLLRRHGRGAA